MPIVQQIDTGVADKLLYKSDASGFRRLVDEAFALLACYWLLTLRYSL
jgi:hypothetical protein